MLYSAHPPWLHSNSNFPNLLLHHSSCGTNILLKTLFCSLNERSLFPPSQKLQSCMFVDFNFNFPRYQTRKQELPCSKNY
jgi:hypothetical protein